MTYPVPLQHGVYYHIYNRGNNREVIFKEARNYDYFLKLWNKYLVPIADTYAFCLLPNHFHALVRIKEAEELTGNQFPPALVGSPSRQFSNFFNAYAKAINSAYNRTGALFQKPFKRITIQDPKHLLHLVAYIHQNPQRHGLSKDFRSWIYSSYHDICDDRLGFIQRDEVLDWFGGLGSLTKYHLQAITPVDNVLLEDVHLK